MALQSDRSPLVFDAAGQSVVGHVRVSGVRVKMGDASGLVKVLNSVGGAEMFPSTDLDAHAVDDIPVLGWLDGLYVDQLPAGAKVYVWYD